MKKRLLLLTTLAIGVLNTDAQTTANFENLSLSTGTYWAGSATAVDTMFNSGNATFPNKNDSYWEKGWSYSNIQDSITAGYTNNHGSRAGSGYNQSANYAVGKSGAVINLTGESAGKVVSGMYINNGTYAALSMKDGDSFAKKFGGTGGNDPDWFVLTIKGYFGGVVAVDSVNFYLADFTFSDNSQDYIVKDWKWVDLTLLGNVDSLMFNLSSSDVGAWGMNTPAYFCMDNLITAGSPTSIKKVSNTSMKLFPNPTSGILNVANAVVGGQAQVVDLTGKIILQKNITSNLTSFDVSNLNNGLYILNIRTKHGFTQEKFIKK